ncbi:hypothetical protein ACTJJ7_16480 [Phyllobacterium sp. 22229]|uniref:hypothetical protein n=1 Tax=Phyllobacterium sp. 22229 TaxID=3453895 RepID=UPI003F863527
MHIKIDTCMIAGVKEKRRRDDPAGAQTQHNIRDKQILMYHIEYRCASYASVWVCQNHNILGLIGGSRQDSVVEIQKLRSLTELIRSANHHGT